MPNETPGSHASYQPVLHDERALHKHLQDAKITSSLSFPQFVTAKYVLNEGPVRMNDIARFMSIRPASATALVEALVSMRVLERFTDRRDRRIVRLRATTSGKNVLESTENNTKQELKRILESLSDTDRTCMIAIQEKLARNLSSQRIPRTGT